MSDNKIEPSFYAIMPATVRYDKDLSSSQKIFYCEITAMARKEGFCWASNTHFAKLYDVSPSTISAWVSALKDKEHIIVEYERSGKTITKRNIYPIQKIDYPYSENLKRGSQKIGRGYSENLKENNTSINNTSINNNYVGFVKFWNEVNDCNLRMTDSKRAQIKARLKNFNEEEIKISIANRSKDKWINGEGAKFKSDWNSFWRNDEKIERYLNIKDEKIQTEGMANASAYSNYVN